MKYSIFLLVAIAITMSAKSQGKTCTKIDDCCAKSKQTAFVCKLTSPELRERKATVIASLTKQIVEKKELKNGYAYKFNSSESIMSQLSSFVSDEKQCCEFLSFNISVSKDKKDTWLEISGPKGVKDFLKTELEM